jgi:hypothetical protein
MPKNSSTTGMIESAVMIGGSGSNGNRNRRNSSPIRKIVGGTMYATTDLSSNVYLAMESIAVSGVFHMSASQLARLIWRVRPDLCRGGKPPPRETIYRIWARLEERKLIRLRGMTAGGVKKWKICEDAALEGYARFRGGGGCRQRHRVATPTSPYNH